LLNIQVMTFRAATADALAIQRLATTEGLAKNSKFGSLWHFFGYIDQ
jgi:hypothetical protein